MIEFLGAGAAMWLLIKAMQRWERELEKQIQHGEDEFKDVPVVECALAGLVVWSAIGLVVYVNFFA